MDKLARFAWIPGSLGFFSLLVFLGWYFVVREFTPWVIGWSIATGVLLATYAFLDRDRVAEGAQSRAFRYGAGSTLLVILAAAIAGFLFSIARDHDHRWDLTGDKRFSLADQTIKIAKDFKEPVRILAFFRAGSAERQSFEDLAAGLEQASSMVEVEFVDPLRNPRMADEFAVTTDYGTVVLVRGEARQRLESDFSEEALVAALVRLQSAADHRICWSTGHGEGDPDDDFSTEGYGPLVQKMEDLNYTVTKSNILTQGIDRACEALVVARPLYDLLPVEQESIAAYVAEGGRLLVLLEPGVSHELAADLERYGVLVGDDLIFDLDPYSRPLAYSEEPTALVFDYEDYGVHDITNALQGSTMLITARSTRPAEGATGLTAEVLLTTSRDSWGEASYAALDPGDLEATEQLLLPDPAVDLLGPVAVAVAVVIDDPSVLHVGSRTDANAPPAEVEPTPEPETGADTPMAPAPMFNPAAGEVDLSDVSAAIPADFSPEAGGRVVVVGDAEFASTALLRMGGNKDLFLNSLAWLVEEESQLGERPDEAEGQAISLNLIQTGLLWLVSVFVVPGLALLAAAGMVIRRRFL